MTSSLTAPAHKPGASTESGTTAQKASEPGTEQAPSVAQAPSASASPADGTQQAVPATPPPVVEDPLVEAVRKDIADEVRSRQP
jgi:hypothetical protein